MTTVNRILFLLLFFGCGSCQDSAPSEDELVLRNTGIQVPFGRSVYLDPERHLRIAVRPGDRCEIRVAHGDRPRHGPGRLTPDRFPCGFGTREVLYTHYGSRSPALDRISLLLRYDGKEDTIVIPFIIKVEILMDQPLKIVKKNRPLTVTKPGGLSEPIDDFTLQFQFDEKSGETCLIGLVPESDLEILLPRYGSLTLADRPWDVAALGPGMLIECSAFLRGDARYRHTATGDSSTNQDMVPLVVVVMHRSMNGDGVDATTELKREYFQLNVRIRGARENSPPKVSETSLLLMDVNQFVLTALTPTVLDAHDDESPPDQIAFNVTSAPDIGGGYFVHTDDRHSPITYFSKKDLHDFRIAYMPPASDSDVRRIFPVIMEVLDSEGLASEPFTLLIKVNPMNSLAPVVTRNAGISLLEGQSRKIHSSVNLEVSDEDDMDSVQLNVLDGLRHGRLLLIDTPVDHFSPADLDAGLIRYVHDGSDSSTDNIVFRMTDTEHRVEFLFPVTIFPTDDEPPILVVNTGITLHKNLEAELNPFVLSAADVDSEDANIRYILVEPGPLYGEILLRRSSEPTDGDDGAEWEMVADGTYESRTTDWTQQDVTDGLVYYRHLNQHYTHTVMDAITFTLSDDGDPPNVSKEQQFLVKILPLDDVPPELHPTASLRMTVSEFQLSEFDRRHLRYTDTDSDDRLLRYTLVAPPKDLDVNSDSDAGRIVLSEDPDIEISTFTQAQVNHHKVAYRPPPVELGLTPRVIQFEFSVEDEAGNALPGQIFTLHLQPIDNKPPRVFSSGVRVSEGGASGIGTQVLDATDPDTDLHNLRFHVIRLPKLGTLRLHSKITSLGDSFGRDDLLGSAVFYAQDHNTIEFSEPTKDSFDIEVTDGAHRVPTTIHVIIHPTADRLARLMANSAEMPHQVHLDCPEGHSVLVDPELFGKMSSWKSEELGGPEDDTIMFVLKTTPRFGQLVTTDGVRVDRFKLKQLQGGDVRYQHTSGEIGHRPIRDDFNLSVYSTSGEREMRVNVTVEPVDNKAPNVTLGVKLWVPEGQKTVVEMNRHLTVEDVDSDEANVVCTLLIQPVRGYLENTSPPPGSEKPQHGIPITAFRVADALAKKINYVQSIHWGTEPREDRIVIQCSDGVNVSPRLVIPVGISPTNDERPRMVVSGKFRVLEGMVAPIDETVLTAEDLDRPPDQLFFRISRKPRNGRIVLQSPEGITETDKFRLKHLLTSTEGPTVAYSHDDGETTEDEFEVEVTDGRPDHTVYETIWVSILPTDDETPRMTINRGLEVDVGETKGIESSVLKAEDLDSENAGLIYLVRMPPEHGFLFKVDFMLGDRIQNLTKESNFSQADVDAEAIFYEHNGESGSGSNRDVIKFDVTDGFNILIDQHFYISIHGMDIEYPQVVNKGVTLPEGGRVTITTEVLSTSDLDSDVAALIFTVTRAPLKGHLESTDHPGEPIVSFTQLELTGNKIQYVHTSDDEDKMDGFEFEVSDGHNSVYRTFRISLSDVDNKKPILYVARASVIEGGYRTLTPFELKVEDGDTPDELLTFIITRPPMHGVLLRNQSRSSTASSFTMAELEANVIGYEHDGSETREDFFSFTVSDGVHKQFFVHPETEQAINGVPQTLFIDILPMDDGIPVLVVNQGASSIAPLDPKYRHDYPNTILGFQFSARVLKTEDMDSRPNSDLLYVVTINPRHGHLVNRKLSENISVNSFTQGDVDDQNLEYQLQHGENATNDYFVFNVMDKGGNVLQDQTFRLHWAWISLEYDSYSVNESENFLLIQMRRRGYLGETSFVGVSVTDLTAKGGKDYHPAYAKQVQFNPGQAESIWRIRILQDDIYEKIEQLHIQLCDPVDAVLEYPESAIVTITDSEDESVAYFPDIDYKVQENVGDLMIQVKRKGDLSEEMTVICSTQSASATSLEQSTVSSFSDYVNRVENTSSAIRFRQNQDVANCSVVIVDDSLFEDTESFTVVLSQPSRGRIGARSKVQVTILPDPADVPSVYFEKFNYDVDESVGQLEVTVWRTGTDLSPVSTIHVHSKPSKPTTAEAGRDYLGVGRTLEFLPGTVSQTFKVSIIDDVGRSQMEGNESFHLVLRMPSNAILGVPDKAIVSIDDSLSDRPKVQFQHARYLVSEDDGNVTVVIRRTGDVSGTSTVRCYTRQNTARVQEDFMERPNTDESIVIFLPGEIEKECTVFLVNDLFHEDDEEFRLVLDVTPHNSSSAPNTILGTTNFTRIIIRDDNDKPIIGFEKTRYTVQEPKKNGDVLALEVRVVRDGDISGTSVVQLHTKDGSAKSGEDYHGLFMELTFQINVSHLTIIIEILSDMKREHQEVFSVHLKPDKNNPVVFKNKKTLVYIQEEDIVADVTFPSPPMVISLRDYDEPSSMTAKEPPAGYPLICITPCNPKHPDYITTGTLCAREGINDTLTEFRWKVAAPNGLDEITGDLCDIEASIFIASTKRITLDSIYFTAGSRVQCGARAVDLNGDSGLESTSPVITVSSIEGICPSRHKGAFGAEPFTAKLKYTGSEEPDHPNLVKLTVVVPHRDGLLPIVSTSPLSNFELTLSLDGVRIGLHKCSNLVDASEAPTRHGFLTEAIRNPDIIGEVEPYQHNVELRGKPTVRFYRHLDLESCLWKFVFYYNMSELVTECGGTIRSEGQVLNLIQSSVSVRIPLYVSYVFYSLVTNGGWQHSDLQTQLHLAFVYDTAMLWQQGIGAPEDSHLQGYLYPTRMRIRDDGRLVVRFNTEARFRGHFLLSHPGSAITSMVTFPKQADLAFTLKLLKSEPTVDDSKQEWQFISNYAVSDYSGIYYVKLLPCIVSDTNAAYTANPIICNPRDLIPFKLQIRFQQVSDPVAARYSLNIQMYLMKKRDQWMSIDAMEFNNDFDISFQPGDTIYGRVMVDPVQNMGSSLIVTIEKCFVCTGVDGYIPKYDPSQHEYGCIANSPNLLHTFKFIDRGSPNNIQKQFRNVHFNAILESEHKNAMALRLQGSDGFRFDAAPLFHVSYGRQWYVHCIYTVSQSKNTHAHGRMGKRSVRRHTILSYGSLRNKRSLEDSEGIGDGERGTNIHRILLEHHEMRTDAGSSLTGDSYVPFVSALLGVTIFILVIACVALVLAKKCKQNQATSHGTSTIAVTIPNKSAAQREPINLSRAKKGTTASKTGPPQFLKNQENTEV